MAGIIMRMNSKTFLKKFVEDKETILRKYNYVLVSHEINTNGTHENVIRSTTLVPPSSVLGHQINGDINRYYNSYMDYLASPECLHLLLTMVKASIDGMDIILLCSKSEDQYGYLDMIAEFLERNFGIKVYEFEEYKKDDAGECRKIKDIERTKKAMMSAIEFLKKAKIANKKEQDKKDKVKIKAELKDMKKKELKEICKEYGIKTGKEPEKKDLIKKILNKMFEE